MGSCKEIVPWFLTAPEYDKLWHFHSCDLLLYQGVSPTPSKQFRPSMKINIGRDTFIIVSWIEIVQRNLTAAVSHRSAIFNP